MSSLIKFIECRLTYRCKKGEISFALMIDRTNVHSYYWCSFPLTFSATEHLIVQSNQNPRGRFFEHVGKIEVRTNEHILVQMNKKMFNRTNLYINLACLFVWVFVCLYPINVKTAEPIGPKFCVGHHVTPGKVYGMIKFSKICLHQNSIFENF